MRKLKFQRPTGMPDILPADQIYFQKIYSLVERISDFYGFKKIDTPILEETALYEKGTGLTTDIVQKQMFSLRTRGGDNLTLRPEFTPGIIRAYLEHGLTNWPQPVKLYALGPVFRYEHPQAGRYRQFHQFNIEVIGSYSSIIDVQVIQLFYNILNELKLKNLVIEVNSIGDSNCRPYYKKLLISYLKSKSLALCFDCRRRLRENPLRILDCKEIKCQEIVSQAPQLINHLCDGCRRHFKEVLEFLDELELPYRLNPYLVRGLDYYTKTVFEIISEESNESKRTDALAAGGRYDGLVKLLGGPETGAVGGALGIERVMVGLRSKKRKEPRPAYPPIFLVQLGFLAKKKALKLLEEFRKAKIPVGECLEKDSLKAQLKLADKQGARYTLLLGQKEALDGTIIIRDMKLGSQETVKLDKIIKEIKKRLKK
ncbi:MAG: histidine--tRNA ligase [Minisyncoccales bacterium]